MFEFKPGFHEHHTEDCDIELKYTGNTDKSIFSDTQPIRGYWCKTHRQWCYEYPIKIIFEFADGQTVIRDRPK